MDLLKVPRARWQSGQGALRGDEASLKLLSSRQAWLLGHKTLSAWFHLCLLRFDFFYGVKVEEVWT